MADIPDTLQINAWTGQGAAASALAPSWTTWAMRQHVVDAHRRLAADEPVDERDWQDPRVGWGLVVADNDALTEADRARGADLPPPLQTLVGRRNGPILRYRDELSPEFVRRYYVDGPAQDVSVNQSRRGIGRGELPKYLLIWGSPAKNGSPPCVPWHFQYLLNGARFVGRLHLEGKPLQNYVTALLDGWRDSAVTSDKPVVWAVDHDEADITHLMRRVVAEPVEQKLRADPQIGEKVRYFSKTEATVGRLIDALADAAQPPAFVMTTSHGMTGPLNDAVRMAANLGLLVDQEGKLLNQADLLRTWKPNGAIWYSHACCSAGSDDTSQYAELLPDGSVKDILTGVAGLGAQIAPLPTALLGAEQPLRAFIGHVEPTFDWTLRHPENKQPLTTTLRQALYDGMYRARPEPVGMAFEKFFEHVGQLFAQFHLARQRATAIDPEIRLRARTVALRTQLTCLDRQACVILGDPTVALPPLQ